RGRRPSWLRVRGASDHLFGLVVRLSVATHRGRFRAGVELLDPRSDLGVFALEQAVALEIALNDEWPKVLHLEHPYRLCEAKFLEPKHVDHPLNAPAEKSTRSVPDCRQIDGLVRHEIQAVMLGAHAAFADDDVATR